MGLLDPTLLGNLNKLKGLLGETPIGRYVQGKDGGVSVNGLKQALLGMPVFDQKAGQQDMAYAMDAMGPQVMGLAGKIVYHGSPHKFNKFDASKIGTGEGAQAYGHGLYLADAQEVAQGYRDNLGAGAFRYAGAPIEQNAARNDPTRTAIELLWSWQGDKAGAIDDALKSGYENSRAIAKKIKELDFSKIEHGGLLYKADLPDEWIPKMLDWDKPLSQQPQAVVNGFRQMLKDQKYLGPNDNGPRQLSAALKAWKMERGGMADKDSGNLFWEAMRDSAGGPDKAAEYFRNSGVPGIRYLDGGSRGKGQGSYNYVVFPGLEDQVKILERNGVPLGLLGGK